MASYNRPPPSLGLISSSSPARPVSTSPSPTHRHSQSPFRYVKESQTMSEKPTPDDTPLSVISDEKQHFRHPPRVGPSRHYSPSPSSLPVGGSDSQGLLSPIPRYPSPFSRSSPPLLIPSQLYTRPRALRISNLVKPWIPLILYGITSLGFLVAIAFWKTEVFQGLDELSHWLRIDEQFGYAVLFALIFLTTFPPLPLYSTLIILSGYTFGPWTGAIISYCAALSGALTVFILSRTFLRNFISRWLSCTITIKRVVRAIEKRPKLLFLIRLAPYPYNVMNCLLAASTTLTLKTYTVCTALSLFKVIIHTSLGASIHSFSDYHVENPDRPGDATELVPEDEDEDSANTVARMWTIIGITLCVAIFVYLSYVARKAVDEELDDESAEDEETLAFLPSQRTLGGDSETSIGIPNRSMAESPFSSHGAPSRQPVHLGGHENCAMLDVTRGRGGERHFAF
ncbi:hypothetical protein PILCRDRAFT_811550 [Piloderma croceum F 1598]|uniref:Golgi apparatus membrane protein TVP38 n=1 Tax=Piloderma croceum (strain F 1598) TaxID=765440 RepID=A0A0C3GHA4_PILCF|nr:hypothetical protein PILCRDRAFT_811550 [Piloderma croceum F 1598]